MGKMMVVGNKVVNVHNYGKPYEERNDVCECDAPVAALSLLDRAYYLNDVKRMYTASARLFAQVECLPGFRWLND